MSRQKEPQDQPPQTLRQPLQRRQVNRAQIRTRQNPRLTSNALKHGLFAKTATPIPQLGESPEELRSFITEFTRALKPTTPAEQALAHRAANTYYRLARIQKLESNILSVITDTDNPNAKPAAARLNSLIADAEKQLHNLHLLYTRVITDPLTFENPFYEDHEYLTINAINQYLRPASQSRHQRHSLANRQPRISLARSTLPTARTRRGVPHPLHRRSPRPGAP